MLFNAPPDSSSPEIIRMLRASSGFQMLNAIDFLIQPLLREPVLPTLPLSGRQGAFGGEA
jgi:hypothetical protein